MSEIEALKRENEELKLALESERGVTEWYAKKYHDARQEVSDWLDEVARLRRELNGEQEHLRHASG